MKKALFAQLPKVDELLESAEIKSFLKMCQDLLLLTVFEKALIK